MGNVIEIDGVHKSFGRHHVHKGLSFSIPRGKITFIIGPSGTGKSVLLKLVLGLLKPDEGNVYVDGEDVAGCSKKGMLGLRRKFGMLFQYAALFDSMNVYENVSFPLREHTKLKDAEMRAKVREKLRLVGLGDVEDKYPSELSGGMRKRVGLARAIVLDPSIILYDEPTTGLDPIMTDVVNELIYDTQKKLEITSVVISHDVDTTLSLADYIVMLYDGKVVMEGLSEDFRRTDNEYVKQFFSGSKEGPIRVY